MEAYWERIGTDCDEQSGKLEGNEDYIFGVSHHL